MSHFRIRNDARKWFSDIRSDFNTDFDCYYFCFIAGITCTRKLVVPLQDTSELVNYFPGRFTGKGKLLVTLFLST